VVTATCRLGSPRRTDPRRLPVKTTAPCPKERIGELLADIYALRVEAPVEAGQGLIVDWKGSGLNVVAARGVR
jgi:CxxC motif-containing protein